MHPNVNGFRQRLWRWHFFAGLIICPFLILISITGSIYLFKAELEQWEERGINAISKQNAAITTKKAEPIGEATLLQNVIAEYPAATFLRLTLAKQGDSTVEFDILPKEIMDHPEGGSEHAHHNAPNTEKLTIWVDRYSGKILEVKVSEDRFLNIVKKLHSELLLGNTASYIVELVASWAIVLLTSGSILWFYKSHSSKQRMEVKPSKQIFSPQLKINGRFNLRTVHAVIGLYISIPLMLMLLTGLPWTQLWGNGFKELKEFAGWSGPKQEWFVTLKSGDGLDRNLGNNLGNKFGKPELPEDTLWEISDNRKGMVSQSWGSNDQFAYTLTDIASKLEVLTLAHPIYISPPKSNNGVWTVRSMPPDRAKRVTLHFDQFSAQQISRIGFEDHHPVQRVVSHGISLHEGALFGTLNKVLVLITALSTTILCILGLMTWLKRRSANSLGIPRKVNQDLPTKWLIIILLLCLFLPAFGVCIIVLASLQFIYNSISNREQRSF
ncbi:MAG: PepSY domain-containing protein [Arenicella sp.]|nr:PepSY domain-containing protein [Arenicella sp.]